MRIFFIFVGVAAAFKPSVPSSSTAKGVADLTAGSRPAVRRQHVAVGAAGMVQSEPNITGESTGMQHNISDKAEMEIQPDGAVQDEQPVALHTERHAINGSRKQMRREAAAAGNRDGGVRHAEIAASGSLVMDTQGSQTASAETSDDGILQAPVVVQPVAQPITGPGGGPPSPATPPPQVVVPTPPPDERPKPTVVKHESTSDAKEAQESTEGRTGYSHAVMFFCIGLLILFCSAGAHFYSKNSQSNAEGSSNSAATQGPDASTERRTSLRSSRLAPPSSQYHDNSGGVQSF
eukprot:gnl/TRDRNA2_/TRDRNA2_64944_c0_seq1.p1 gnl/TRDRNA2_/TRDRNA2_64944_c0~~gnl/TRDRNA2_/TRDRNA2_64944_c0_seq1.p1  ORF type:complete len:292 (+),score=46.65 gnl/TRDRNA2_/TRDRNA2_64944_c0_seq1:48-923(+)